MGERLPTRYFYSFILNCILGLQFHAIQSRHVQYLLLRPQKLQCLLQMEYCEHRKGEVNRHRLVRVVLD